MVILKCLEAYGINQLDVSYIRRFLERRRHMGNEMNVEGVPQGDPMSMLLFAAAINWLLRQTKGQGHLMIAYADDIIIAYKEAS